MQEDQYQHHPARSLLGQLLDIEKNEAFSDSSLVTSPDFVANRDFIFAMARTIVAYFEETPAVLVSSAVNNLTGALQNALNNLIAFTNDRNANRVAAALAQMEQLPPHLTCFIGGGLPSKSSLSEKLISGLQQASKLAIQQVIFEKEELSKQLVSLQSKYADQERKFGELSEAIGKQKADALATSAQVQKEFAETEQKRLADFTKTLTSFKEAYQEFSEEKAGLADTLIQKLEKSRDDAKDLLQVVGAITLTGNYKKVADAEERQANAWRYVTTGFFTIGVLLALLSVGFAFVMRWNHPNLPVADVYIDLLMRLLTAIAITSPAWYFAKESARHRTNADRAKQRETELTSLGPFIELLPEEKRNEIRATLTSRYFGNDIDADKIDTALSGVDGTAMIGKAIDTLPKLGK